MALQSARAKRAWRTVWSSVLVLGLVVSLAPAAMAEHFADTVELEGATPVDAAVAFSQETFPNGAEEAVLGRDNAFADSLASGVLQSTRPLLLTSTATLSAPTDAELKRLKVKTVHILGGVAAVSPAVEQQLVAAGYTVRRHSGPTRIETAIAVARVGAPAAGSVLIARAFATGTDQTQAFADSLAAGAWSAATQRPVLLTESERLSAATGEYLQSAKPARAYVVGGTGAVSEAAAAQIQALGIQVERVSGATRFHTAVEVARRRGMNDGSQAPETVLLEGQAADSWAAGFAAAAYAAKKNAAVLLANGTALPEPTTAFLTAGDDSMGLLCAPGVSTEACDAAATTLEKRAAAAITMTQTTVPQYGTISGTVTPPEDVVSLTASGCGLDNKAVVVNQDGTFTTRIDGAPGQCTLTFSLTTNDGSVSKTFPLTVTDPIPATAAPELVKAETVSTSAAIATVRYVFSEPVKATVYEGSPPAIGPDKFLLYEPRTTTAASDTRRYKGQPLVANQPPTVRRDPANNKAVLVDFARAAYDAATTAAVERHAAEDVEGTWNPPHSVPLKTATLPGGRTVAEDLTAVGAATTTGAPAGKFLVPFTFDAAFAPADLPAASDYRVVTDAGWILSGQTVAVSDKTHTVQFDPTLARKAGAPAFCTSDCPTLQQAVSGVRRGFVVSSVARRPSQGQPTAANGVTVLADLMSATANVATRTVDFTFDEAVQATSPLPTAFKVYQDDGTTLTSVQVTAVSATVVRATFDALSKLVVGATVDEGAVATTAGKNAPAGVGITVTFAAGELLAPSLESGTAALTSTDPSSGARTWKITWVFDRVVQTPNLGGLLVYTSDGKRYGRDGGDAPGDPALTDCAQTDGRTMTCNITFPTSAKTPALVSVLWRTAEGAEPVAGVRYENIERSVRL